MPTYAYECPKCKKYIEIVARITDEKVVPVCAEPGCDGNVEMKSVLFPVGFQLRGSGWTPKYHR